MHLHRNVPGVLARVNGLLAEQGVNVEAQLLGTRGEIGYVVTDSASGTTQEVVDQIRAHARDDPAARHLLNARMASVSGSRSRGRPCCLRQSKQPRLRVSTHR